MKNMIDIKNLDFQYSRNTQLLSDLNLEIEAGRIHGLLGKNGEGKSTLLKLISGLLFPIHGKIDVMGFEPLKRNPKMLQSIFFLPEEFPNSTLSIRQFVQVYGPFYTKFRIGIFNDCINEFGVDSTVSDISKLSFGQKKKVMIAFGLATNAKIILMDEPTNGLDIPAKGQFRQMVASTINSESCIVISSHQVLDLENLINKIIIMDEHKILFNENTEKILKKLYFMVTDEIHSDKKLIYRENTTKGLSQVYENTTGEVSKLDIELLFTAVISQKIRIKQLFRD